MPNHLRKLVRPGKLATHSVHPPVHRRAIKLGRHRPCAAEESPTAVGNFIPEGTAQPLQKSINTQSLSEFAQLISEEAEEVGELVPSGRSIEARVGSQRSKTTKTVALLLM